MMTGTLKQYRAVKWQCLVAGVLANGVGVSFVALRGEAKTG